MKQRVWIQWCLILGLFSPLPVLSGEQAWLEERFGRPTAFTLKWTANPEEIERFQPSGIGCQILRCGEYTLLHNHGLYYSNEENPSAAKDQQASVLLFRENQPVFVARGYKFHDFMTSADHSKVVFFNYAGRGNDGGLRRVTLFTAEDPLRVEVEQFSVWEEEVVERTRRRLH